MNKTKLKNELLEELVIAANHYPIIGCSQESAIENDSIVYKHKEFTMDIEGALVTVVKSTHNDNTTYAIAASLEDGKCPISFSSEEVPSNLYNKIYTTLRKRYKYND